MYKFIFLIVLGNILVIHTEPTNVKPSEPEQECIKEQPKCGKNEVLVKRPQDCPSDYCPKCADEDQTCTSPEKSTPACKCKLNYRRTDNGTCIPTRQCPPFDCSGKPNQEYDPCPPLCPNGSCAQARPDGQCPLGRIGIINICRPQCRCIKDYFRNDKGNCVPYYQCPGKCGKNEVYSECIEKSGSQSCSQPDEKPCDVDKISCTKGCVCKGDYLKAANGTCVSKDKCNEPIECGHNEELNNCTNVCSSDYCKRTANEGEDCISAQVCGPPACKCRFNYSRDKNGTCIPTAECPPFDCSAKPNQKYDSCPPLCPNGSCAQARPDKKCPLPGRIGIVVECKPRCSCIDNYYRNDAGDCVPYSQCPGVCPENEVYSNCTQTVCNESCSEAGRRFNCPLVKVEDCKKGCLCKKDYYRQDDGTCVPQDQCKNETLPLTCSTNEEVRCVKECPPEKTCRTRGIQYRCQDDPTPCQEKCVCKDNHYRNSIGECISNEQCDTCTGDHEFYSCGPECDNECSDLTQNRTNCLIINIKCNEKCYCDDGWARDNKRKCVPIGQCPTTEKCGPNEVYDCKKSCPPETCLSLVARFKCDSEELCKDGCHCKSGFLRQDKDSPCVPICQCNEMKNSPDCQSSGCDSE